MQKHFYYGAIFASLVIAGDLAAQNLILNPDFAGGTTGWIGHGSVGATDLFGENVEAAFFSNGVADSGGFYQQGISGVAGVSYTFSIGGMRLGTNTDANIHYGLEFFAADDTTRLGYFFFSVVMTGAPRNDNAFSPEALSAIAPPDTAWVRPVIKYDTVAFDGGDSFYVFATELTASSVPEPSGFAALAGFVALGFRLTTRRRTRA